MTTAQGAPGKKNQKLKPGVKVGTGGGSKNPGKKSIPAKAPAEKPPAKGKPSTNTPSKPGTPSKKPMPAPVKKK